jgi:hypothetical protein
MGDEDIIGISVLQDGGGGGGGCLLLCYGKEGEIDLLEKNRDLSVSLES